MAKKETAEQIEIAAPVDATDSAPVKANVAAPGKPKAPMPLKLKDAAPSKSKVAAPVKAKAAAPAKAKDAAPAKAKDAAPTKAKDAKPGKAKDAKAGKSKDAAPEKLSEKDYQKELAKLHVELVKLQEWVKATGAKICICFEGRDGAGKGGVIKAITERVSPRVFRVMALAAPTEREKSQMYVQRYLPHLPAAGEIVIFDRSWYNRAGVERVLGFCKPNQVKDFLKVAPEVERAIVDSGIILVKYWLEVGPDEQTKRLKGRIGDGRKIWKLSPLDLASYDRWNDYSKARDDMFKATDTDWAPWYVAYSDDKKRARLNIIKHLLSLVPYKSVPRPKIKLPKRKVAKDSGKAMSSRRTVPATY